MTVPSNVAWGSAVGTGIIGPYAIPFGLYTQSWLKILTVANNVPSFPVLGTDYTFTSWTPDNKGWVANPQITFTNPVAGGTLIVFLLMPPGTQQTAISNFSPFFPQIHEMTFDQLTQLSLMLLQWAGKSIKAPDWESAGATNLTLPPVAQRASMYPFFDVNGNLTVVSNLSGITLSAYMTSLIAAAQSQQALYAFLGIPFYQVNMSSLTGSYDNVDIVSVITSVLFLDGNSGNVTFTGVKAYGFNNQRLTINNADASHSLTLKHASTSSLSNNRIYCPGGSDLVVSSLNAVDLVYMQNVAGGGTSGWVVVN